MASLDLPVQTRMASFSRLEGMSLASGVNPRFTIPVGAAVSGEASRSCMTSFKAAWSSTETCMSCAWAMGYIYMCVLILNNSLDVGQQSVQLPDEPRHSVWHGI